MDDHDTVFDPGWVLIEADRISELGSGKPSKEIQARADRTIDASRMIVSPGLVNGHDHLCQTFMTGVQGGLNLFDWLDSIVVPLQEAMSPDDVWKATLLGLLQNLRSGVTTVVEHLKLTGTREYSDASARAATVTGQRVLLAWGWQHPSDSCYSIKRLLDDFSQFYEDWHSRGRLSVALGPLNTWSCSPEALRRTTEFAQNMRIPVHIHVSETKAEVTLTRGRAGLSPIRLLETLGVLTSATHLVHCVWPGDEELALISRRRASVVHCPTSNLYLASGIAPLVQMLRSGINVALGTDGSASGHTHDLLTVARLAGLLAKQSAGDAAAITPYELLKMATASGAQLLGRDDIGRLVQGAKADIAIFGTQASHLAGAADPKSALLYQATGFKAETVIVNGEVLLDEGRVEVVDESALLSLCEDAARVMRAHAQLRPKKAA